MKALKDLQSQLKSHLSAAGVYARVPFGDDKEVKEWNRNKRKWVKERKVLEERVRFLEVPNAEKSLLGMRESLLHKISVIDQRWEDNKDFYLVEGLRRDEKKKRKNHHHAQYSYSKLVSQLKEVEYLLDE